MSVKVLLVGVGGFGFRHYQSLCRSGSIELAVCDTNSLALERAKDWSVSQLGRVDNIRFYNDINELPNTKFDWCIVATDSRSRLAVVKAIASQAGVRNILLEKVVFNKLSDYDEFDADYLGREYENVFVNFSRRLFPFYVSLKDELQKEKGSLSVVVRSKDLGLGCNGLHYIDLFEFLSAEPVRAVELLLAGEPFPAKRSGYLEFFGKICAESSAGSVTVLSGDGHFNSSGVEITISKGSLCLKYSEREGIFSCQGYSAASNFDFPIVQQQSELTADIVLTTRFNCMASYVDIRDTHRRFLDAARIAFENDGFSHHLDNGIPIT